MEFNKATSECCEHYEIKNLNARIFEDGGIEFDIISGYIFKEKKTVRINLKDNDYAQELISYLN